MPGREPGETQAKTRITGLLLIQGALSPFLFVANLEESPSRFGVKYFYFNRHLVLVSVLEVRHYSKDTKVSNPQDTRVKEVTSWHFQGQLPVIGKDSVLWQESRSFRLQEECSFLSAGRKRMNWCEVCKEHNVWAPWSHSDGILSTQSSTERTERTQLPWARLVQLGNSQPLPPWFQTGRFSWAHKWFLTFEHHWLHHFKNLILWRKGPHSLRHDCLL